MRSLIFLILFSSQAFAALSIRDLDGDWSNGHEGVYDDVLDITWLADANYAKTSGYSAQNYSECGNYSGCVTDVLASGQFGWQAAKDWADSLEIFNQTNWRLPSIVRPLMNQAGYLTPFSELGHMYNANFGFSFNWCCLPIANSEFTASSIHTTSPSNEIDKFSNIYAVGYWNEEQASGYSAWSTNMISGSTSDTYKNSHVYAWAVHDGDVGNPVPLPAGFWLFASGLISLRLFKR